MRLPTPTSDLPARPVAGRESAFSLVELIVVVLIIAILMAVVMPKFFGARQSGKAAIVVSAAQSYVDAVDSFALDRAGRVPILGNATDWPLGSNRGASGPLQPIPAPGAAATATPAPYLGRAVPEAVTTGRVALTTGARDTAAGQGTVVYRTNGGATPTAYALEVWVKDKDGTYPSTMHCYYGTMTVAGATKCS